MASSGSLGPWLARERLETELSAALGCPVRVERVEVGLWRGRVLLDGIAVAAGPGWEDGTLLQAPRLVIGVRLASLWRRELVLGAVLQQPAVRLVAGDEAAPLELPVSVPDRITVGPVTVRVSAVEVEGGDVSYADPAAASRWPSRRSTCARRRPGAGSTCVCRPGAPGSPGRPPPTSWTTWRRRQRCATIVWLSNTRALRRRADRDRRGNR